MTPIETATLVTSLVVVAIGTPLAFFHRAIAEELRHLRDHFRAAHEDREAGKGRRHPRRTRD